MTDADDPPTPLSEPQQIPGGDDDRADGAPDLPDELETDGEVREPGI
jgi:hypothetical protein